MTANHSTDWYVRLLLTEANWVEKYEKRPAQAAFCREVAGRLKADEERIRGHLGVLARLRQKAESFRVNMVTNTLDLVRQDLYLDNLRELEKAIARAESEATIAETLERDRRINDLMMQKPEPSPHHPPDMKVGQALAFERGTLTIKQQGYGEGDGSGRFAFADENVEREYEEGHDLTIVDICRSDLLFLRDHLNRIFPPEKAEGDHGQQELHTQPASQQGQDGGPAGVRPVQPREGTAEDPGGAAG